VRTQRKLKTEEFREQPRVPAAGRCFVTASRLRPARFAELPAARLEAQAVAMLGAQALLGPDALQAVNALLRSRCASCTSAATASIATTARAA
jgi:hypothetical protein